MSDKPSQQHSDSQITESEQESQRIQKRMTDWSVDTISFIDVQDETNVKVISWLVKGFGQEKESEAAKLQAKTYFLEEVRKHLLLDCSLNDAERNKQFSLASQECTFNPVPGRVLMVVRSAELNDQPVTSQTPVTSPEISSGKPAAEEPAAEEPARVNVIEDYEIIDHGIDHPDYFQGCGTYGSNHDHVQTGNGDGAASALEDALTMVAQSHSIKVAEDLHEKISKYLEANVHTLKRSSAHKMFLKETGLEDPDPKDFETEEEYDDECSLIEDRREEMINAGYDCLQYYLSIRYTLVK